MTLIDKNLELMISNEPGGMYEVLIGESMGGNAGRFGNYLCAGANFYFNENTGEIIYFGNIQNVPDPIVDNCADGIFRVAWCMESNKYLIIETCLDLWKHEWSEEIKISEDAKNILEQSVNEFNKKYGFEVANE